MNNAYEAFKSIDDSIQNAMKKKLKSPIPDRVVIDYGCYRMREMIKKLNIKEDVLRAASELLEANDE